MFIRISIIPFFFVNLFFIFKSTLFAEDFSGPGHRINLNRNASTGLCPNSVNPYAAGGVFGIYQNDAKP